MKVFPIFLVFTLLQTFINAAGTFCSMMCSAWGCGGYLTTQCQNKCNTNWVPSGNTCMPSASQNWYLENTTPDLGGNLTVSGATGPSTSVCWSFNMYGTITSATQVTVTHSGVTLPFFQMIAYVGVISMDVGSGNWGGSTLIHLDFSDGTISAANTMKLSSKNSNKDYCFAGPNENWNRMIATYTYNTTGTALTWKVYNDNTPNTSALWGFKEFILITRRCSPLCESCYGMQSTQCWSCVMNATVTYWQSNNTCSTVCLNRFGYTDTPNICVYCDLRCSACFNSMSNCSACTTSGTWASFLDSSDPANITCVNPCSPGTFANKVTRTCDKCNENCSTCLNSANYCLSCEVNGSAWYGWTCYTPCPAGFFQQNSSNCTPCSAFCSVCDGSSTLCTECTLTGIYKAFLFNTTNATGTCLRLCNSISPGYYA